MRKRSRESGEVEEYYDTVSGIYDRRESGTMHRLYTALTWPWILGSLPAHRCRILDAGGGTGKWAIPLAQEGHSIVIIDISQGMLDKASEKAAKEAVSDRVECRRMDFENIPCPRGSFDVVLCDGDALGLAENPQKALTEFGRVLVGGGVLLLGVSNTLNLVTIKAMNKKSLDGVSGFLDSLAHREPSPKALSQHYAPSRPLGVYGLVSGASPRFVTFTPLQIERMLRQAGLSEISVLPRIGFSDYLDPSVLVEAERDQALFDRILGLERKVQEIEGSAALGGHLLVKARKPTTSHDQACGTVI